MISPRESSSFQKEVDDSFQSPGKVYALALSQYLISPPLMKDKSSRDTVAKSFEICYGVAKDPKNHNIVVPIVVKKQNDKAVLHGVDSEGVLIGPCKDGKDLLKRLGIQSWLQGNTLTPVKDRPTFWQRSLISAVSHPDPDADPVRLSFRSILSFRHETRCRCRSSGMMKTICGTVSSAKRATEVNLQRSMTA